MKTHLLIIDPQNDFCIATGPGGEKGTLVVPGAEDDMNRLAAFIDRNTARIEQIHVTLDSHQLAHIAHPIFWSNTKGEHPAPFSTITEKDTADGVWFTSNSKLRRYGEEYTRTLKKNGRYQLMIWPPHCLIGTWGHSIVPAVAASLLRWEESAWKHLRKIDFVAKGSNVLTEHYSAMQADVPDNSDPSTKLNTGLLDALNEADEILGAGEALSHCLAFTGRDIAANFRSNFSKFVLLEDAASNVTGCESLGKAFVKEMRVLGMRSTTTKDW